MAKYAGYHGWQAGRGEVKWSGIQARSPSRVSRTPVPVRPADHCGPSRAVPLPRRPPRGRGAQLGLVSRHSVASSVPLAPGPALRWSANAIRTTSQSIGAPQQFILGHLLYQNCRLPKEYFVKFFIEVKIISVLILILKFFF